MRHATVQCVAADEAVRAVVEIPVVVEVVGRSGEGEAVPVLRTRGPVVEGDGADAIFIGRADLAPLTSRCEINAVTATAEVARRAS